MNYDSIIQKLLTSTALLKIMSNNYSIKGILLGGSRLLELESPQSDYDLNILISESDFQTWNFYTKGLSFPPIYFKVEDKLVHWYYTSDRTLPSSGIHHRDFWVIESYFAYNKLNKQPLFCADFESFYRFKELLQLEFPKALKKCKNVYLNKLKDFLAEIEIDNYNSLDKDIYHLIIISNLLQNNTLDKSKLLKIKEYSNYNDTHKPWESSLKVELQLKSFISQHIKWLLNYFELL